MNPNSQIKDIKVLNVSDAWHDSSVLKDDMITVNIEFTMQIDNPEEHFPELPHFLNTKLGKTIPLILNPERKKNDSIRFHGFSPNNKPEKIDLKGIVLAYAYYDWGKKQAKTLESLKENIIESFEEWYNGVGQERLLHLDLDVSFKY